MKLSCTKKKLCHFWATLYMAYAMFTRTGIWRSHSCVVSSWPTVYHPSCTAWHLRARRTPAVSRCVTESSWVHDSSQCHAYLINSCVSVNSRPSLGERHCAKLCRDLNVASPHISNVLSPPKNPRRCSMFSGRPSGSPAVRSKPFKTPISRKASSIGYLVDLRDHMPNLVRFLWPLRHDLVFQITVIHSNCWFTLTDLGCCRAVW